MPTANAVKYISATYYIGWAFYFFYHGFISICYISFVYTKMYFQLEYMKIRECVINVCGSELTVWAGCLVCF